MKYIQHLLVFLCSCISYAAASDKIIWEIMQLQTAASSEYYKGEDDAVTSYCKPYAQSCIEHYNPRCRRAVLVGGCISLACGHAGYGLVRANTDSLIMQACSLLPIPPCFVLWAAIIPENRRRFAQCIIDCCGLEASDLNKKTPWDDIWR